MIKHSDSGSSRPLLTSFIGILVLSVFSHSLALKMATLFNYQVSLNGTTAYLLMNSTPDEQGRIDLTLELNSDGNKVSTTSKLIIPKQDLPPKPSEPVHPDRWCILPVNQPIYQALMDKAASYPADKVWQARAYRKAAQGILTYNYNIFDINNFMNWRYSNGIGYSIETFVGQFITDFKHLPDALNYLE